MASYPWFYAYLSFAPTSQLFCNSRLFSEQWWCHCHCAASFYYNVTCSSPHAKKNTKKCYKSRDETRYMRSHIKTVWEEQLKNLAQSKRPSWWCVWSGGCCGLICHPYAGRPTPTPPQSHVRNAKEEGGFCWQNDPKVLNSCLYFSLRQQIFSQLIQKRKIYFHHLCIRSMATTTLRHFKSRIEVEL